jgi:hypothetical protein
MKTCIAILDGMGGGIGAQLVSRLREALEKAHAPAEAYEIIALGSNSSATERMLKAGADRGASGENAIRVSVGSGDYILGPIGIVIPNGLMGEFSPAIALAISKARGEKILVPVSQNHFTLAGVESRPLPQLAQAAVETLMQKLGY